MASRYQKERDVINEAREAIEKVINLKFDIKTVSDMPDWTMLHLTNCIHTLQEMDIAIRKGEERAEKN